MSLTNKKEIESDLVIECISRVYGCNFKNYIKGSIRRRLDTLRLDHRLNSISELIPLIIQEKISLNTVIQTISISVTEMFREPDFFIAFKKKVIPILKKSATLNMWCAGCSTGEEPYSLAILLYKEHLLTRTQIYATDFNVLSLEIAKEGSYSDKKMHLYEENYNHLGYSTDFNNYFLSIDKGKRVQDFIKGHIFFSSHNLAHDHVFIETQVIVCRNVLIYFNKTLKEKVMQIFHGSLNINGILCLGMKEHLMESYEKKYRIIDKESRIYQKIED